MNGDEGTRGGVGGPAGGFDDGSFDEERVAFGFRRGGRPWLSRTRWAGVFRGRGEGSRGVGLKSSSFELDRLRLGAMLKSVEISFDGLELATPDDLDVPRRRDRRTSADPCRRIGGAASTAFGRVMTVTGGGLERSEKDFGKKWV